MTVCQVISSLSFFQARSNVLIVDWKKGATYPYYLRAARNTPVPGVQLSLLIQKIIHSSKHRLSPNSVHVVGFSLGAQVAGFCGRHFHRAFNTKLGRITGIVGDMSSRHYFSTFHNDRVLNDSRSFIPLPTTARIPAAQIAGYYGKIVNTSLHGLPANSAKK